MLAIMLAEWSYSNQSGNIGRKALYKFNPPCEGHELIILSSVDVPGSGIETYAFPAKWEEGNKPEIIDWTELNISQKGTLSHQKIIEDAGYTYHNGDNH